MTLPAHYRRVAIWGWLAMLVAGAAVFAACGSPDDGEDAFTFDPQPYITWESGTPIAANPETCGLYPADQVEVAVEGDRAGQFAAWAERVGFRIADRRDAPIGNLTGFSLIVPVGSVPDAILTISEQPGVIDAAPNYLVFIGPEPTPDPALGCEAGS